MADSTAQTVLFTSLADRPVVAKLDHAHSSSDGGLVLLQAADQKIGLSEAIASSLRDSRECHRVHHTLLELIRQRICGIACGYSDANDATGLKDDPLQKLALGRDPIEGLSLASQPTLSRFENGLGARNLVRMGYAIADTVLRMARRGRRRVQQVTLDLDPTDDPTHGQQPLAFFHGYYGHHCYLPLVVTMTLNGDPEQYVLGGMLRPGNAAAPLGFEAVMRRLLPRLRNAFPKARILVRLDGGFAVPEVLDFLEQEQVQYVIGMAMTLPLAEEAADAMACARTVAKYTGKSAQIFGDFEHQTENSWPHERRVVYKAEVVCCEERPPRDNLRFVVTNLSNAASRVYDIYRRRGEMENRIKELKSGLQMDRTSCSSLLGNQARVLLTVAAYVLLQAIRVAARGTEHAHSQVQTLRLHLLKLAAWVERSVRRIVIHLPHEFPGRGPWLRIATRLGAAET